MSPKLVLSSGVNPVALTELDSTSNPPISPEETPDSTSSMTVVGFYSGSMVISPSTFTEEKNTLLKPHLLLLLLILSANLPNQKKKISLKKPKVYPAPPNLRP